MYYFICTLMRRKQTYPVFVKFTEIFILMIPNMPLFQLHKTDQDGKLRTVSSSTKKEKKGVLAQTFKKNEASPINKLLANSKVTFIKAFIKHIFLQRVLQGPPLNLIN